MTTTVAAAREALEHLRAGQALFEARCARLIATPFYPSEVPADRADSLLDLGAVVIDADPSPAATCAGLGDRAEDEAERQWWRGLSVALARRGWS